MRYPASQIITSCDKSRERFRIVLRLCHQVSGYKLWCPGIAHDDNFGWAGKEIDRTVKGNQFLGSRDVNISRADNLVHAWNALRSVCECGDRLRSPDAIEFTNSEQSGSSKHLHSRLGR